MTVTYQGIRQLQLEEEKTFLKSLNCKNEYNKYLIEKRIINIDCEIIFLKQCQKEELDALRSNQE